MRIFFDTEFTGLHKETTLVSIGLVGYDGKRFYAELTDYDEDQCGDWITKNVLDHLILSGNEEMKNELYADENATVVLGNKETVAAALREWLEKYKFYGVQFVSDVCHYDMVLLIDLLWGSAIDIPDYITPFCEDITQMMIHNTDMNGQEAFDISREQFLTDRGSALPKGRKHNSLYDAEVIKAIYESLEVPFA